MENVVKQGADDMGFWRGKKVFVTGHTGFKGSWLCLWLSRLGAQVYGYALAPPTDPSLFELAGVSELVESCIADVRDLERLKTEMIRVSPDVVIHMAAQPLVRDSYRIPVETYSVNVMGSVHLLEAVRACPTVRAVVNVTTDKVYENREWSWGYRESDSLGGYDPYSNSKGCSELVTAAYRSSYFVNHLVCGSDASRHGAAVATARAGNVIGGGDWAADRLIPDILRAIFAGEAVRIRNPHAIRPWQHVLEPLSGYLMLAERLYSGEVSFAEGWNFGPPDEDARSVEWIVSRICDSWGNGARFEIDTAGHPHEATYLKLDCSKAVAGLGWKPRWKLERSLDSIVAWARLYTAQADLRGECLRQIDEYEASIG